MNELQWKAVKTAALAILITICVIAILALSFKLGVLILILGSVGAVAYVLVLENEKEKAIKKIFEEERKKFEERQAKIYGENNKSDSVSVDK